MIKQYVIKDLTEQKFLYAGKWWDESTMYTRDVESAAVFDTEEDAESFLNVPQKDHEWSEYELFKDDHVYTIVTIFSRFKRDSVGWSTK